MQKLKIELPKHRIFLHFRVVKRRKSIFDEALIPTVSDVKRKYRKGTLVSRYFRHILEHKHIKKVLAAGFSAVIVTGSLLPQKVALAQDVTDKPIVEVRNTLVTQKGIQYPIENFTLSQGFSFFHPGVDLADQQGDPVKPIKPGKVTFAGSSIFGYGNMVEVDHGEGLSSLYAHLSKIEVKEGQEVTMYTEIGKVGQTGRATGPHLHLEIHDRGLPINPLSVLSR